MSEPKLLEYEEPSYPQDFMDDDEAELTPQLPPFKASKILYCASALYLFSGVFIPLLEMMTRNGPKADVFISMVEWNAFSQLGLFLFVNGYVFFWLGLMTDRRGA